MIFSCSDQKDGIVSQRLSATFQFQLYTMIAVEMWLEIHDKVLQLWIYGNVQDSFVLRPSAQEVHQTRAPQLEAYKCVLLSSRKEERNESCLLQLLFSCLFAKLQTQLQWSAAVQQLLHLT
jgi:hypothetical protein